MLYFSRIKLITIYFIILVLSLFALLNFVKNEDNYFFSKNVNLGLDLQGGSYLLLEVDSDPVLVTQAFVCDFTGVRTDGSTEQDVSPLAPFYQITTLLDSGGRSLYSPGDAFRVNPLGNRISQIQNLTVNQFLFLYDNIAQVLHPNSFTFDDSANSQRPDFSVDLETMDNEIFTTYLSDSAY